jgi:hypothetical protein
MKIAKPLLIISTPIGVIGGLHEAYRLTGGLVVLMLAMVGVVAAAIGSVVLTVRRERANAAPDSFPKPATAGIGQTREAR